MELTVFARLARRFTGGFVLAFHGISPERFTGFIECLGSFRPVHLGELVERVRQGRPNSGLFAITVDDGVGENTRALAAALEARQWPGTFYLPTDYLDSGEGMPFQRWQLIRAFLPRICGARACEWMSRAMRRLMHTRPRREYEPLIRELADYLVREEGVEQAALDPPAPVSWSEVERLARSDAIRFESHGRSHTAVSALNEQELGFEMRSSRDLITEHTGRQCRHFAYPYGGERSIGGLAPVIAARLYDSAATMTLGSIGGANPWLMPRIPLYEENSRAFARLKIFLKCTGTRGVVGHPVSSAGLPASWQTGTTGRGSVT